MGRIICRTECEKRVSLRWKSHSNTKEFHQSTTFGDIIQSYEDQLRAVFRSIATIGRIHRKDFVLQVFRYQSGFFGKESLEKFFELINLIDIEVALSELNGEKTWKFFIRNCSENQILKQDRTIVLYVYDEKLIFHLLSSPKILATEVALVF